jgi:hypothetical protein
MMKLLIMKCSAASLTHLFVPSVLPPTTHSKFFILYVHTLRLRPQVVSEKRIWREEQERRLLSFKGFMSQIIGKINEIY